MTKANRAPHAALALLVAVLTGCFSHRATTLGTNPDGTAPAATYAEGRAAWSFGWGLWGSHVVVPPNCNGQPLADVRVSSNLGFALLTVATLGAVAPVYVAWECARPTPVEGAFPIPADTLAPRLPDAPAP